MTDQTPAETLRAAAQRLRDLADAATPGPWAVDPDRWAPPGWSDDFAYIRVVAGEPNPISGIRKPVVSTSGAAWRDAEDCENHANATLIAALGPDFARAVADWLDAMTFAADFPESKADDFTSGEAAALAVAHQILDRSDT